MLKMISTRNLDLFVPHAKCKSRKAVEEKEGEDKSLHVNPKDLEIMSQIPASSHHIIHLS